MNPHQDQVNQVAAAAATAAASAAVTSTAGIMKELADIKMNQEGNRVEIKNIVENVKEIKSDVKDIKALYVTHVELHEFKTNIEAVDEDHEARLRWTENTLKYGLGALAVIQFGLIIYVALHKG